MPYDKDILEQRNYGWSVHLAMLLFESVRIKTAFPMIKLNGSQCHLHVVHFT